MSETTPELPDRENNDSQNQPEFGRKALSTLDDIENATLGSEEWRKGLKGPGELESWRKYLDGVSAAIRALQSSGHSVFIERASRSEFSIFCGKLQEINTSSQETMEADVQRLLVEGKEPEIEP